MICFRIFESPFFLDRSNGLDRVWGLSLFPTSKRGAYISHEPKKMPKERRPNVFSIVVNAAQRNVTWMHTEALENKVHCEVIVDVFVQKELRICRVA